MSNGTSKHPYSVYEEFGHVYPPPDVVEHRIHRYEYKYIESWIEEKSKVLDLGCGSGSLGERLITNRGCDVYGMDIDENAVAQALQKGLKARVSDMDLGLDFEDGSFDYVTVNVTLQMVYRPGFVLTEALRVGSQVIVSFPNFGHLYARLQMLLLGRMPKAPLYGYKWYDTRHIHLFSYADFKDCLKELNAKIVRKQFLWLNSRTENKLSDWFPNLFSGVCILMIEQG